MRLLLLAGGEVALVAVLLVGDLRLLPSGEARLAVLLRRVLVLLLSAGEVRTDRCGALLGHRGLLSTPLSSASSATYPAFEETNVVPSDLGRERGEPSGTRADWLARLDSNQD
jgi:hypothetical protein